MELKNTITQCDCLVGMKSIEDGSIDCILTDPPYFYLKNQKLDREFDEKLFFNEAKRVLKKDGFIVLFGRGTSFYRWNTRLADLGFTFKEEIIWNKSYCSSPLMNISRVHETISIHTKGKGIINKVKIPYLEMKGHDIDAIVTDIKRLKTSFKNTKSLNSIISFMENNKVEREEICRLSTTISSQGVKKDDRCSSVMHAIKDGVNEKSIIRTDFQYSPTMFKYNTTGNKESAYCGDRSVSVLQSVCFGMNEKSIIRQSSEHYKTIHPTQKPVRLLERLMALVTHEGDLVLDPFSGSASTAIAAYNTDRRFICFEIDKEYYDKSVERLDSVRQQLKMKLIY
ncbi:MAG: site-specific DNA-methyltransferase [Bacteroidales bacterium]|jgi:site-specific DNA-methyltransferase (adenine-specific)|nr:site-specific DNA-methyltransferase [Bacteroidales bacterium]